MRNLFILLILAVAFKAPVHAQKRQANSFSFTGLVYGYHNDPRKKFLSKDKEIALEGVIKGVQIEIKDKAKTVWSGTSQAGGVFEGSVPLGKIYTFTYSKSGYADGSFTLNLRNVPDDIAKAGLVFSDMELILNSYVDETDIDPSKDFGKLSFNGDIEAFEFIESVRDKKNIFEKNSHNDTPKDLMLGSIHENGDKNSRETISFENPDVVLQPSNRKNNKNNNKGNQTATTETNTEVSKVDRPKTFKMSPTLSLDNLSEESIENRESEIAAAWKQLEQDKLNATTPEELAIIEAREELLMAAEKDLEKAKEIIDLQTEQIESQQSIIYLFIFLAILLLGFAGYIYWTYRQKAQTARILEKKNKQITDSINYASRIQESILLPTSDVKKIFPESFIYYEPRDIVSGDFYWFAEINGKKIAAAIDCTGHGVPGAFMSMIGNTLMNQVVKEKGVLSAGKILDHLHEDVVKALRQEPNDPRSNQDGMDMAICVVDEANKEIEFAGAMNPMYIVQNGSVEVVDANKIGVGGTIASRKMKKMGGFKSEKIKYQPGTTVYMFSDGYMDQFGGNPKEKFNIDRFKELLAEMTGMDMNQQGEKVNMTFKNWKGEYHQLDDVLLLGLKLS